MPWNGSGTFTRIYSWVTQKNAGYNIIASQMDADTDDIVNNGLDNCLTRDGQGSAGTDLPMNGYKHLNVADGAARNQYLSVGQDQDGGPVFATGAGTGDAITATYAPAITAPVNGMLLRVRAPGANTITNPTFAPNGLTARTITKNNGSALAVGEYGTGQDLLLSYDSSGPHWDLLNLAQTAGGAIADQRLLGNVSGGAALPSALTITQSLDILSSTQGQIPYRGASAWGALAAGSAGQILQANGVGADPSWAEKPVLTSQVFTGSGTFTTPANTLPTTIFKFSAAGGGGGGAGASNSSTNAGDGGGSGGCGYALFSGFGPSQAVTISIGAGGSAGSNSGGSGGAGGNTTVTANAVTVMTATGGGAGIFSNSVGFTAGGAAGTFSASAGASGLTLVSSSSLQATGGGVTYSAGAGNAAWSGFGGSNSLGSGGKSRVPSNNGDPGNNGGGGSGGCSNSSAQTGGAGGAGVVIVEWVL